MKLEERDWTALCAKFTREPMGRWFAKIVERYQEPHRRYHNGQHIAECLSEFRAAKHLARHPAEVELALWLHDVVYDPRRADNEEKSAEFAIEVCRGARVDEEFEKRVANLILATKHNAEPLSEDARLVVDVDLAILGQLDERFWNYEKQIREEYPFVPEELFRSKRAEILEKFLKRERIYGTEFFFGKYDLKARVNLKRSISALRSS